MTAFLGWAAHGVAQLPWWAYVIALASLVYATVLGVTVVYHRALAHHAVRLRPWLNRMARLWVWMSTGMAASQWVAVHRAHHAAADKPGDPHSPQILGLMRMVRCGPELYARAAVAAGMVERYARDVRKDRLENFSASHHNIGIAALAVIEIAVLGLPGLCIWALQMLAMPLLASAFVNGLGHYAGYRNFETRDASRNVIPWGVLAGGEELHNNHHASPGAAKFSRRWFEIDAGWWCIKALAWLRLASIRKKGA